MFSITFIVLSSEVIPIHTFASCNLEYTLLGTKFYAPQYLRSPSIMLTIVSIKRECRTVMCARNSRNILYY